MNDDFLNNDYVNDDDDRYYYEHYENKDYYGDMPRAHKSGSLSSAIIWILGIIIAIATWDSPGVIIFYALFVLSGKMSGMF